MRIGHGYDVHRIVEGRKLLLGGCKIASPFGLLGHSDADVLIHAIMDALLGAAALADIGVLFPDNNESFRDASSLELLKIVGALLYDHGYSISNIDCTVIAQQPKIFPFIPAMRHNIATALGISTLQVNVKATTEEGLGFTGSLCGIAAHAVCIIS